MPKLQKLHLSVKQALWRLVTYKLAAFNGWQLAKMKKSIPDMSLP